MEDLTSKLELARALADQWTVAGYYGNRPAEIKETMAQKRASKRMSRKQSMRAESKKYWRGSIVMSIPELQGILEGGDSENEDEDESDDDGFLDDEEDGLGPDMSDQETISTIASVHRRLSEIRSGKFVYSQSDAYSVTDRGSRRRSNMGAILEGDVEEEEKEDPVPPGLLKNPEFADNIRMEFTIDRLHLCKQCSKALEKCSSSAEREVVRLEFSEKRRKLTLLYIERVSRLLTFSSELQMLHTENSTSFSKGTRALFSALRRDEVKRKAERDGRVLRDRHGVDDKVKEVFYTNEYMVHLGDALIEKLRKAAVNMEEDRRCFFIKMQQTHDATEEEERARVLEDESRRKLIDDYKSEMAKRVESFERLALDAMSRVSVVTKNSIASAVALRQKNTADKNFKNTARDSEIKMYSESHTNMMDQLSDSIEKYLRVRGQRAGEIVIEYDVLMRERRRLKR